MSKSLWISKYGKDVEIRRGQYKDIPTCRRLLNTDGTSTWRNSGPSAWWLNMFLKEKQLFIVAQIGRKVVGCIFGERLVGNGMLLQILAVDKSMRSQGIGSLLMKSAEEESVNRNCTYILLYGFVDNPAVAKMVKGYKSNNFIYKEFVMDRKNFKKGKYKNED